MDVFEPHGASDKLHGLLYAHGGAFSYKVSPYHKKLACLYAMRANCRVFFPDYHLTPKYPYPAAYTDVLALYRHMAEHAGTLGLDPERLGVAGDSAGGTLAAQLCQRYEVEGLPKPCLQMFICPGTDVEVSTDSMKRFPGTPLWNVENNRRMWSYYLAGLSREERYAASPMHGALSSVIPDTYIETAEFDCLRDEGVLYGQKLRQAEAQVEINETKGTFHGCDSAIHTQAARLDVEKRVASLKKGFRGKGSMTSAT